MSDRIAVMIQNRGERPLVIPYLTAGYPHEDETLDLLLALEAGGADAIELGMPFSDPLADGPVIQRAMTRALAAGILGARVRRRRGPDLLVSTGGSPEECSRRDPRRGR